MIVTRFAPSPTGLLHLGHAYAAITACESGDDFLLRIEDIDKGRSRDQFIQAIFHDLKWLGLSWDEPTLRQSTRMGAYAEALVNLKAHGLVYPCFCPRAEIAAEIARAGEAQHFDQLGPSGPGPDGPLYPGTCKALSREDGLHRIAALGGGAEAGMALAHALEVNALTLDGAEGARLRATWGWAPALLDEAAVRELARGWFAALEALVRPQNCSGTAHSVSFSNLRQCLPGRRSFRIRHEPRNGD